MLCKEEIVDHRQLDNGKNATQRVSADADIDMLICAGDLSHSEPVSRFSIKLLTFLLLFYSFKIIIIIINHNKS